MALIRIFAKFGDLQLVNATVNKAGETHGLSWADGIADYIETRAIALARADLPAQASAMLEKSQGYAAAAAQNGCTKPVPPYAVALREIMLAWTRSRDAGKAWSCLSELMALGYGRSAREWNALLDMHAKDMRYRYPLLEQVLARMRNAKVKYSAATYNIMMHGCLLRGLQTRWKEWFERMERDGFQHDTATFTTLLAQLARSGQWNEALKVVQYMRRNKIATMPASVISIERQRNRIEPVMRRFRHQVLRGGEISASEFTAVVKAILDSPKKWAAEAALAIRCLEDGRVAESAVVDALAAQLPGIGTSGILDRPLLSLLQKDAGEVAESFMHGIQDAVLGSKAHQPLAVGAQRRSFVRTLNIVIRFLARGRNWKQVESLVQAASAAEIDTSAPHTLVSLLHWCVRVGCEQPPALQKSISAASFVPPSALATAKLIASTKAGDMAEAQKWFEQLEQQIASFPSVSAFNALLMFAASVQDTALLESKWRQMEMCGIMPDTVSHKTRIFCYSQTDNLLRTRRAYTDMLDFGYPPSAWTVSAMVRCCVRKGDLDLALCVIRHAERVYGSCLNATTYNYVLSRLGQSAKGLQLMRAMFQSMLETPDARLYSCQSDIERDVSREKLRFVDLRILGEKQAGLGSWLLRPSQDHKSSARFRRALVSWITSRAAYSADPIVFEDDSTTTALDNNSNGIVHADAPPPTATTFIIVMRASGKYGQWEDVMWAWRALSLFNQRVSTLSEKYPQAKAHHVVPISRMVGWAALALVKLGHPEAAENLWTEAAEAGTLSPSARKKGMNAMISQLSVR
ncbi:hypothetical protein IWW36_001533 [Coemansia brasiliensis]|uniref:Pentatricopeptide repeat-containing protein n=1 Tax=Coemansia brasiliensis TaxID=2650707 RepID=A0A9W8M1X4_9FUNG|nr:hypothetical protein IWW36_001533 [Coemansia brasiliensis]